MNTGNIDVFLTEAGDDPATTFYTTLMRYPLREVHAYVR